MLRHDHHPVWSTSSMGQEADTSPMELAALSQHLGRCQRNQGRLFAMRCHGETVGRFVASRVVTTLVVGSALVGAGALLL
ncbi:hypothetical protein [Aquabacterium sp.]|uniref:hypothetical protein n=1 Tax=Aquabacterium sp. TaxID=1872578 RepID=UPI003BAFE152